MGSTSLGPLDRKVVVTVATIVLSEVLVTVLVMVFVIELMIVFVTEMVFETESVTVFIGSRYVGDSVCYGNERRSGRGCCLGYCHGYCVVIERASVEKGRDGG
jgi:hypothetical protein